MASTDKGVTVVDHPLVQHKLTLMRDKERSTKSFRQLLNEIGMLLCYEITRDLPITMTTIETPLETMQAPVIAGKKLVFAPILRAGVGFLDGMLEMVPGGTRRPYRALPRSRDVAGSRILLQGSVRHRRPYGHCHGPDAGHGEFRHCRY
jgi:hypothetical protein